MLIIRRIVFIWKSNTRISFYKKLHFWGQASSFLSSFLDHFKFANFKNLTTKIYQLLKCLQHEKQDIFTLFF